MKGEIEVRFVTAITVALAMLFTVITINSIATTGPDEDVVATDLETLYQVSRIANKYTGEALSYAYYLEVNNTFDPRNYSNESTERWNVPKNLFKYPEIREASCESTSGKLGCVVWNLYGGGDPYRPCPNIRTYRPNPDPRKVFNSKINVKNIEQKLKDEILKEISKIVATGTTSDGTTYGLKLFGKNVDLNYNIKISSHKNSIKHELKINVNGYVNVKLRDQLEKWVLDVNRMVPTDITMVARLKYSENKKAYCICKRADTSSGRSEVLEGYIIGEYYIEVNVVNNNTNETITYGKIPYIKYFVEKAFKPVYDGKKKYKDCELIVP